MTSAGEPFVPISLPLVENLRILFRQTSSLVLSLMRHDGWSDGSHTSKAVSEPVDRGSRRRLRRITLRGSWSVEFWLFVLGVLALLFATFRK
jgi:hypothetical protein